jgi:hypothetical protein
MEALGREAFSRQIAHTSHTFVKPSVRFVLGCSDSDASQPPSVPRMTVSWRPGLPTWFAFCRPRGMGLGLGLCRMPVGATRTGLVFNSDRSDPMRATQQLKLRRGQNSVSVPFMSS